MSNFGTDPTEVLIKATEPERNHYYLRPDLYELYEYPSISVVGTKEYQARVLIKEKRTDISNFVAFNSLHYSYEDAERAIRMVCDTFAGLGSLRVWDIFAETTGIQQEANIVITQTRVLHWQLQQLS